MRRTYGIVDAIVGLLFLQRMGITLERWQRRFYIESLLREQPALLAWQRAGRPRR